jgi:hypothetical protein
MILFLTYGMVIPNTVSTVKMPLDASKKLVSFLHSSCLYGSPMTSKLHILSILAMILNLGGIGMMLNKLISMFYQNEYSPAYNNYMVVSYMLQI